MATETTLDVERLEVFSAGFSGSVVDPGHERYGEMRKTHNGLIDKRPALIARCRGTADVVDAIAFARAAGLEISVRGGGHSVAGRAVTTGGVVSTTGIAGLTLGGGLGWLNGVYGLAVDNLLSVELVTADGEVLNVTEETHPDLFWALRGGGGNFGVATSFEYRLHPLREVVGGLIAHPFDAAPDVLRAFREHQPPDELWVVAGLVHAPDGSGMKLAALVVCHAGSPEQAERDLRPLLEFGSPVLTEVGPMPYPVMNTLLDAASPPSMFNYWKSSFMPDLPDPAINALVERFAIAPSPLSAVILEGFHGAVCRVGVADTAVPHREPGYNLGIFAEWTDQATTEENIAWTRDAYAAIEPYRDRQFRYVNYLDDDDAGDAVRAAYGPNYDRLVDVKRRYDPDNVFHLNHNIDPAG